MVRETYKSQAKHFQVFKLHTRNKRSSALVAHIFATIQAKTPPSLQKIVTTDTLKDRKNIHLYITTQP